MLGTATVLRNQTDMAFPMCFVQVSRILWLIALLAFPLKLAHDMVTEDRTGRGKEENNRKGGARLVCFTHPPQRAVI